MHNIPNNEASRIRLVAVPKPFISFACIGGGGGGVEGWGGAGEGGVNKQTIREEKASSLDYESQHRIVHFH